MLSVSQCSADKQHPQVMQQQVGATSKSEGPVQPSHLHMVYKPERSGI